MDEQYRRQVALLVRTLPHIAQEKCFALKGGTAINLFLRDLPRLSVDIDLTYLPVAARARSLNDIDGALRRIRSIVERALPSARVQIGTLKEEGTATKIFVRERGVQIKVEVTPVFRGCVFDPEDRAVKPAVEEQFEFAVMKVVSFADLFAGKLLAALDRQHPRDLFDVHGLLSSEGISDELRAAFVVYLIGHHRNIESLLAPSRKELHQEFERGLKGMMARPLQLDALIQTREEIILQIVDHMPESHCEFLRTFARGVPDWGLLQLDGADNLPAVKWRMKKLEKLNEQDRSLMIRRIDEVLPN